MQGLDPAQHRRQGMVGGAHDIVQRLLPGQGNPRGLHMAAHPGCPGIFGTEAMSHDAVPEPANGPNAGDLFKKIIADRPEKCHALAQPGGIVAALLERRQSFGGIDQRHGHFGDGRGSKLAQIVAVDGHKVPLRHLLPAKLDIVTLDPETILGRNVFRPAANHLLQGNVVLDAALQTVPGNAAPFSQGQVHGKQDG